MAGVDAVVAHDSPAQVIRSVGVIFNNFFNDLTAKKLVVVATTRNTIGPRNVFDVVILVNRPQMVIALGLLLLDSVLVFIESIYARLSCRFSNLDTHFP